MHRRLGFFKKVFIPFSQRRRLNLATLNPCLLIITLKYQEPSLFGFIVSTLHECTLVVPKKTHSKPFIYSAANPEMISLKKISIKINLYTAVTTAKCKDLRPKRGLKHI